MNYKHVIKSILAGDWEGIEVHDKRTLAKAVVWSLGILMLITIATGIQSCAPKQELPPHIQVNAQ